MEQQSQQTGAQGLPVSPVLTQTPGPSRPTGTVTFLFTDIEGSTRQWELDRGTMQRTLAGHDATLRGAAQANGGYVFKTIGDAFCVAFSTPDAALATAIQAQRAIQAEAQGTEGCLRVRMAIHTGVTEERDNDYFGPPVNRVARLLSAAHGCQILVSGATQRLLSETLPPEVALKDLGEHRLRDLSQPEWVYQVIAPGLRSDFPPLRIADKSPNNLPIQPTAFIGRESELASLVGLLSLPEVRLVALTGPAGTGKTRLGLHVAAQVLDRFEHGVWFVNLAPISDPTLVASEIARILGVREVGNQPLINTLKDYLRDRNLLLILDNFEQLVEAATLVSDLLANSSELRILVTSRVRLHLRGEREFEVPPLQLPDLTHMPPIERLTQYEAVALFIQRAVAIKQDFQVTNESAPTIAEICYRLDGLPLAIELAAARTKILPPQAMLSRLQHRLQLLTSGDRDLPARQQTLRAAIDWSYDLLNQSEQLLFRRLAVFVGGANLEAVAAICNAEGDLGADTLDLIASLIDNSLLKEIAGAGGEPRFVMLQTILEFATERLEETDEVTRLRERHNEYFLSLARSAGPKLRGPEQGIWYKRMEDDQENLRAALNWVLCSEDTEGLLRLIGVMWEFWDVHGDLSEGRRWIEEVLACTCRFEKSRTTDRDYKLLKARTLFGQAMLAFRQGVLERRGDLFEQSLALFREAGDEQGEAFALTYLGVIIGYFLREFDEGQPMLEQALALHRKLGNEWGVAETTAFLGYIPYAQADYARARALFEESLNRFEQLGDERSVAWVLLVLGEVARCQQDYATAESLYERSLDITRKLNNRSRIGICLNDMGYVLQRLGNLDGATDVLVEGLQLEKELGNNMAAMSCVAGLAGVALLRGDTVRAARLLAAAGGLIASLPASFEPSEQLDYDRNVAAVRAQLDQATFEKAWQEGSAMSLEQTVACALEVERAT